MKDSSAFAGEKERLMNVAEIRDAFPLLSRTMNGRPLIYLDNAATTQVPIPVIRAMEHHLTFENANVHRGSHLLSVEATESLENARGAVADFLGASSSDQVVFTSGATDSLTMVAFGLAHLLDRESAVVTTQMEHHANLIPWQRVCAQTGAELRVVPVTSEGELDGQAFHSMLEDGRAKIVALCGTSNVSGCVNPLPEMAKIAHAAGAIVVADLAQSMRHALRPLAGTEVDLIAFSAHKMCGPTGVGVLAGKREILELVHPLRFGGGMVDAVTCEEASFSGLPSRLEAGTPNVMGIVGLAAAVRFLEEVGMDDVAERERVLTASLVDALASVPQVQFAARPQDQVGAVSFVVHGCHHYDVAAFLDAEGVAVRVGHHCAEPYVSALGHDGVIRMSTAFYNTEEEIARAVEALKRTIKRLEVAS